jgi:hypothetical protein
MWKTLLKVEIPNKTTVYKPVENFLKYPQFKFLIVQTLVIHILYTGY